MSGSPPCSWARLWCRLDWIPVGSHHLHPLLLDWTDIKRRPPRRQFEHQALIFLWFCASHLISLSSMFLTCRLWALGLFLPEYFHFLFFLLQKQCILLGFPGGSVVKNLPASAGDMDWIGIGSGRSFGKGNGKPLQYSCLGNPWIEEPGRGHKRIGHKLATKQQQYIPLLKEFF